MYKRSIPQGVYKWVYLRVGISREVYLRVVYPERCTSGWCIPLLVYLRVVYPAVGVPQGVCTRHIPQGVCTGIYLRVLKEGGLMPVMPPWVLKGGGLMPVMPSRGVERGGLMSVMPSLGGEGGRFNVIYASLGGGEGGLMSLMCPLGYGKRRRA